MNALVRNLLFALLAVGTIAAAGDQAPPPGQDSATPKGSAPAQKESDTPAPAAKPTPTPTPTPTADPDRQLEEFVPSEELPADRAVAFPVDI
jgi:hypothetical protein